MAGVLPGTRFIFFLEQMSIKLEQISGIARTISFKYPTIRAIIIVVTSIFVLGTITQLLLGNSFSSSIAWAFGAAVAIFFSWALTRELDPDHSASSFISVAFMFAALFFTNLPSLLALFWFLLITRILNRITGIAPKFLDLVGIIVLATVLSWQEIWVYGLITALVLYVDSTLDDNRGRGIILALIVTPLVILSILLGNTSIIIFEISAGATIAAIIISLLFIPLILFTTKLQSLTDITEEPVSVFRLRMTRIITIVIGLLTVITQGNSGFTDLLPLWTAIASILVFYVYCKLFRIEYS